MAMQIRPLAVPRRTGRFDLADDLASALRQNNASLADGDIVAVSSKYAAGAQGRLVDLRGVRAYPDAVQMASRYRMSPEFAEVVSRESGDVLGGMPGFVMSTTADGILAPNAGIDRSNSGGGGGPDTTAVILYPDNPHRAAEHLRRAVFLGLSRRIGVIITDSRLLPARAGTTGVAVACAGIEPVTDMRATPDLDGRPLRVTVRATADELAAAANHVMGEGSESRPYAVISGSGARLASRTVAPSDAAVPRDQCIYMRSLPSRQSGRRRRGRRDGN